MNRKIKFRALKDDMSNCNFVYGELVYDAIGMPRITHKDFSGEGLKFNSCLKGTEGQFTGLFDKNGNEIYEGDLVQHDAWNYPFEIIFNDEKARFVCKLQTGLTQYIDCERLVVVGNIHETVSA